jgi:hypothetical protein
MDWAVDTVSDQMLLKSHHIIGLKHKMGRQQILGRKVDDPKPIALAESPSE